VPDDLLRYVFGPQPYSSWWLWWAVLAVVSVICWYTAIFVWTLPSHQLRRIPVARRLHARLIRHGFARRVRRIAEQHLDGRTSAPAAAAEISRTVRSFLHQATGARAQYLHVDALKGEGDGELAAATPLLTELGDAQFNSEASVDIPEVSGRAQELIRSWT
jgi:hypothetical protein